MKRKYILLVLLVCTMMVSCARAPIGSNPLNPVSMGPGGTNNNDPVVDPGPVSSDPPFIPANQHDNSHEWNDLGQNSNGGVHSPSNAPIVEPTIENEVSNVVSNTSVVASLTIPILRVNDLTIIVDTNGALTALNSSFNIEWTRSLQKDGRADNNIEAAPAVGPNGILFVGSNNGYLYAVDSSDGSIKAEFDMGSDYPIQMTPLVDSDLHVYIGTNRRINPFQSVVNNVDNNKFVKLNFFEDSFATDWTYVDNSYLTHYNITPILLDGKVLVPYSKEVSLGSGSGVHVFDLSYDDTAVPGKSASLGVHSLKAVAYCSNDTLAVGYDNQIKFYSLPTLTSGETYTMENHSTFGTISAKVKGITCTSSGEVYALSTYDTDANINAILHSISFDGTAKWTRGFSGHNNMTQPIVSLDEDMILLSGSTGSTTIYGFNKDGTDAWVHEYAGLVSQTPLRLYEEKIYFVGAEPLGDYSLIELSVQP